MLFALPLASCSVYRSVHLICDIASRDMAVTTRPYHSLSKMYVDDLFQCAFVFTVFRCLQFSVLQGLLLFLRLHSIVPHVLALTFVCYAVFPLV